MNIRRFQAPTAREALALARAAFGDGTLVLSNRQLADGVEVLAAAEAELSSIDVQPPTANLLLQTPATTAVPSAPAAPVRPPLAASDAATTHELVRADTEQLAMSTLSFQDYVRERMLRKQEAARALNNSGSHIDGASHAQKRPQAAFAAPAAVSAAVAPPAPARSAPAATVRAPAAATVGTHAGRTTQPQAAASAEPTQAVMHELRAMRQLMEDRFTTLSWLNQARHDPVHSSLMLKFVRAGYSAALARAVLEPIAGHGDAAAATQEVMSTLDRMLDIDPLAPTMTEEGGVFALIGATGVGKTTTIAKLAAQCAALHGAASVGLVTLDAYRAGAHEQLRAFGRGLGIVAHLAHDRAALQELLGLLAGKKMVLIDTAGVAPRDSRRRELLEMLDAPGVKRVLVLNAGANGDMLDEVASAFKTGGARNAVLSKVDEAVKLGPVLDTLMRHQLKLRGIACGQRVPEDWKAADGAELVRESMQAVQRSPFDAGSADLDFHFSPDSCAV